MSGAACGTRTRDLPLDRRLLSLLSQCGAKLVETVRLELTHFWLQSRCSPTELRPLIDFSLFFTGFQVPPGPAHVRSGRVRTLRRVRDRALKRKKPPERRLRRSGGFSSEQEPAVR